jgi:hypothetical protein
LPFTDLHFEYYIQTIKFFQERIGSSKI